MQFSPITDWRNWHTATMRASTQAGAEVTVARSATDEAVYLSQRLPPAFHLPLTGGPRTHAELTLTAVEAFELGAQLMTAALQCACEGRTPDAAAVRQ